MAVFKVIKIIDGDTIEVSPNWIWNDKKGSIVKILGYTTPSEQQVPFATRKLKTLLSDKSVELKGAQLYNPDSDAIACSVFLNGVDISKYFPEFQNRSNIF